MCILGTSPFLLLVLIRAAALLAPPGHERRLCSEVECLMCVEGRDDMKDGRYGELSFLSAMGEAFLLPGTMSAQSRRV
jgi:hypothetical protein